jgi:hypothetical protein
MPAPKSKVTTNCKIACSCASCGLEFGPENATVALALAARHPMVLLAAFCMVEKTHSRLENEERRTVGEPRAPNRANGRR